VASVDRASAVPDAGSADEPPVQPAIFHGTYEETRELLEATERACMPPDPCVKDHSGKVIHVCAAHRALLDQRFLNGVLFMRHDYDRWMRGEWHVPSKEG
jgi:hypothetical protein